MRLLPLLLFAACDPEAGVAPQLGPPPVGVTLELGPTTEGLPSRLTVRVPGVGTGYKVRVAVAESGPRGTTCLEGVPACFTLRNAEEATRGVTDAAGEAHLWWTPAKGERRSYDLQAMVLGPGDGAVLSSVEDLRALISPNDLDSDGLDAAWETARGLDPTRADSDGGGTFDAQEVLIDGTNPLDPADDLPGERMCLNNLDDDDDGFADCEDPDCPDNYECVEYLCEPGRDDDEDGLFGCADPDCAAHPDCGELTCADGVDDDGDGLTDCDDDDCWGAACQAEIVMWVESGQGAVRVRSGALEAWVAPTRLRGGVWVDGPDGPAVCRWEFGPQSDVPAVSIEPACRLTRDVVPDLAALTFDPAIGLIDAQGGVFLGPFTPGRGYPPSWQDWSYEVAAPLPPYGACAGGAPPVPAFLDRDGDGVGQDGPDLYGLEAAPIWVCDPSFAGAAPTAGDCDDDDPTWTPTTVTVAPGVTCADLRWDDQDGDGSPASVDADDRDGTVP